LGSGFLVKSNGFLVTNKHVISGASQITVTCESGEKYHKAFLLAEDDDRDIAILRIEGSNLPYLILGNSSNVEMGEDVLLIGAPKGLAHTVSNGIVSALRMMDSGTKVMQTTAAASPGSSGGPLLTKEGAVVGVMTFAIEGGQNLNFAIPSNYVLSMIETLDTQAGLTPLRTLTKLETLSNSALSTDPGSSNSSLRNSGTLFVAWRTDNHRAYSTSEVFHGIVDELLLFLKENRLKLANDYLGSSLEFEHKISTYETMALAKKFGASYILVLIVDRPVSKWVKLQLQCLSSEGKLLWEEEANGSTWGFSGANGVKVAMKKLKSGIANRLKETPLPTDETVHSK
jgi:hypothetical protein